VIGFDDSFLLRGKSFRVSDLVTVSNPRVGDIFDFGEEKYFSVVTAFIATPFDYKVQLTDMGYDYESMDKFEFLYPLIKSIRNDDSRILFGDIDFTQVSIRERADNNELVLLYGDEVVMDTLSYALVSEFIRKINGFPLKKPEKYLNEHVKQYILDVERNKLRNPKKEQYKPVLLNIVSALVNSERNPYDYGSIMDISISQLHDSLSRVQKIQHYENVVDGMYHGTVSSKDVNMQDLNWLS